MDFFSRITANERSMHVDVRARSYYHHHENFDHVVLLIHGFSACPATLKPLGNWLHQKGINVYGMRLSGHGSNLSDFESSSWQDWEKSVNDTFDFLQQHYTHVSVIGSSMGALLALRLAAAKPVYRLVCMGTFIKPKNLFFYLCKPLIFMEPYMRFSLGSISNGTIPEERSGFWYERLPIRSILELYKVLQCSKTCIPDISCPSLVLHAPKDPVAHRDSATFLFEQLPVKNKQLFWFGTEHVFVLEPDKAAYAPILSFLQH